MTHFFFLVIPNTGKCRKLSFLLNQTERNVLITCDLLWGCRNRAVFESTQFNPMEVADRINKWYAYHISASVLSHLTSPLKKSVGTNQSGWVKLNIATVFNDKTMVVVVKNYGEKQKMHG